MFPHIPAILRSADFARVRFELEFQESCEVGVESILRLRRDLHKVGRHVLGDGERFLALFDPPVPADPEARRRHQRPGPPFALHPPDGLPGGFGLGDILTLPAVFVGGGIQRLSDFVRVLQELGEQGLHRGEGRFEVAEVTGADAVGTFRPLWRPGESLERIAPPLLDMRWWLESALPPAASVRLEFATPARLLAGSRPLFRSNFPRLFPFLLRRVTSMLSAHCALELVDAAAPLLEAAAGVEEKANRLEWEDWRVLEGPHHRADFGGVVGALRLEGEDLAAVLWVLGVASLLNVGRGAAFGAGHLVFKGVNA